MRVPEQHQTDIKDVMLCLGEISGKLETLEKSNTRVTLALIGIIAAQIGVKVLGTPILLDIATTIGIFGAVILLGVLYGIKIHKEIHKLTKTGKALIAMITCITITQIMVYFRDLGVVPADVIYAIRIFQNITITLFAWFCYIERHLYKTVN